MTHRRVDPSIPLVLPGTSALEGDGESADAQWRQLQAWYDVRRAAVRPGAVTGQDLVARAGALRSDVSPDDRDEPIQTGLVTIGSRSASTSIILGTAEAVSAATRSWIGAAEAAGARIIIPAFARRERQGVVARRLGKDHRHLLYRLAFPLGRTLAGLEAATVASLVRTEALAGKDVIVVGLDDGVRAARIAAHMLDEGVRATFVVSRDAVPGPAAGGPIDRLLLGEAWLGPVESWPTGSVDLVVPADGDIGSWITDRLGAPMDRSVDLDLEPRLSRAARTTFQRWLTTLRSWTVAADRQRAASRGLIKTRPDRRAPTAADLQVDLARSVEGSAPIPERKPAQPRSRLIRVTAAFTAYELSLDTGRGLTVWAHVLIPRDRRRPAPAVVAQHGLGGRPGDVTGIDPSPSPGADAYHAFGARLAERGFVVIAPYLTVPEPQDELINPLVARAVALGEQRSRAELVKLRAVVDWLHQQPFVRPDRIGYYGLSYGGHAALWVAGLEPRIKAVVVSGHANDWTAKTTDLDDDRSFMAHPDEDFTVWRATLDFGHLELVAAAWPRPTLIEAGSEDPITTPAWFARIEADLQAWASAWRTPERLEIDRFEGVHEVAGAASFEFLDRWLWPERPFVRDYVYRLPVGHDLPGIGDISNDFDPFVASTVEAGDELEIAIPIPRPGRFRGVGLRLAASADPGELADVVVDYRTRAGRSLGEAIIPGDRIHPLWDLWHDAPINPRRVTGDVVATVRPRGRPGSGIVVYGPRSLGPRDRRLRPSIRPLRGTRRAEPTHEFARAMLNGDQGASAWASRELDRRRLVLSTPTGAERAASWVREALSPIASDDGTGPDLGIRFDLDPSLEGGPRSHRVEVESREIRLAGSSELGWLAAASTLRQRIASQRELRPGIVTRTERVVDRVTTGVLPAGTRYREADLPTTWTDPALERVSKAGFTGIWSWVNLEDVTLTSSELPELVDPEAAHRMARLERLARRARGFGLDHWLYLAIGYRRPPSPAFWLAHPGLRGGTGWMGPTMCTSDPRTLRHQREVVERLLSDAPSVAGLFVIFDIEGFYFCGSEEQTRRACPRCRHRTSEDLAAEVLGNLDEAVRATGKGHRLVAWSYGWDPAWVERMLARLPASIEFQADFSKGVPVRRGGIEAPAGDDTIAEVGPSPVFERLRLAATGRPFWVKGEHAISLDAIFVPYLPVMEQFAARADAMRRAGATGWLANWIHYGFLEPLPAELFNRFAFDPSPGDDVLDQLAAARYGPAAIRLIRSAWASFSEAIGAFPYSDPVARSPGPIQKGATQPLWLDERIKPTGRWRSWQNDLDWTAPFGPTVVRACLDEMRQQQARGLRALRSARSLTDGPDRERLEGDIRVAATWTLAVESMTSLIDWVTARTDGDVVRMREIALRQRRRVGAMRGLLEQDSSLGFAQDGGGVIRGGLFTPALLDETAGLLDDLLFRTLRG